MLLDPNIKTLMRESVQWERAGAIDRHADNAYGAAVAIACFIEPSGFAGGGNEAIRKPDGTVVDARFDVYFDAADANVQLFGMDDFFTVAHESAEALRTQPERITNFYGPNGAAWLRVVTL